MSKSPSKPPTPSFRALPGPSGRGVPSAVPACGRTGTTAGTPTRRSRDASLHATGYMSATSADMQASSILLPLHNRHLRDPGDPEGAPAVPCGGPHPPELSIFAPKWRFWAIFGQKCPFLGEVKNGAKICANFKIFGPRGAQDFGPQNP